MGGKMGGEILSGTLFRLVFFQLIMVYYYYKF